MWCFLAIGGDDSGTSCSGFAAGRKKCLLDVTLKLEVAQDGRTVALKSRGCGDFLLLFSPTGHFNLQQYQARLGLQEGTSVFALVVLSGSPMTEVY